MFQGQFPVSVFLFFFFPFKENLFLHSISSGLRVKLTSYMSDQLSSLQKIQSVRLRGNPLKARH